MQAGKAQLCVVLFSFVAFVVSKPNCGTNEFYSDCHSACQANCTYTPTICTLQCVAGCACADGYVIGPNGNCIDKKDCPVVAPPVERKKRAALAAKTTTRKPTLPTTKKLGQPTTTTTTRKPTLPPVSETAAEFVTTTTQKPTSLASEEPGQSTTTTSRKPTMPPASEGPSEATTTTRKPTLPPTSEGPGEAATTTRKPTMPTTSKAEDQPDASTTPNQEVDPVWQDCGVNQVFSKCHSPCQATCTYTPGICTKQCVLGCACIDGFVIGPDGECIPEEECPPAPTTPGSCSGPCGQNEFYSKCHSPCQANCTYTPEICPGICIEGCACVEGYVVGPNGYCIPKEDCPGGSVPPSGSTLPPGECGPNEIFSNCHSECQPTCTYTPDHCSDVCVERCACAPGYVLGPDGHCIAKEDCPGGSVPPSKSTLPPGECGKNEEFSKCHSPCQATCNYTPENCTDQCVEGCACIEGFVVGPDGECIPKENCPSGSSPPTESGSTPSGECGPHEFYSKCHSLCQANCTYTPENCPDICIEGCACVEGYVVGPNGYCILKEDCPGGSVPPSGSTVPSGECGQNEIFSKCHSECQPTCIYTLDRCSDVCVEGCACAPGYVLGPDGHCIAKEDCPYVTTPQPGECGPNQTYSTCHSACQSTCTYTAEICSSDCMVGCACIEGYVIGPDGQCIPKKDCPPVTSGPCTCDVTCGTHEHYSDCSSACEPSCHNPSPSYCTGQCIKGCACDDGYVRGLKGECVLPSECPQVGHNTEN